jgi:hypothetical protein
VLQVHHFAVGKFRRVPCANRPNTRTQVDITRHRVHLGRVQLSDEQLVHVVLECPALPVLLQCCLEKIIQFRLYTEGHPVLYVPTTLSDGARSVLTFHIDEAAGGGGGAGTAPLPCTATVDSFLGLLNGLRVAVAADSHSAGFRRSSLWYAALIFAQDCYVYIGKHARVRSRFYSVSGCSKMLWAIPLNCVQRKPTARRTSCPGLVGGAVARHAVAPLAPHPASRGRRQSP